MRTITGNDVETKTTMVSQNRYNDSNEPEDHNFGRRGDLNTQNRNIIIFFKLYFLTILPKANRSVTKVASKFILI